MTKSMFHKLVIMMVFEGDRFDPPKEYHDEWPNWLDDATGQQRCISADWEIEDIDPDRNEIIIGYSGEDAHSGVACRGIIYTDFDGNVKDVSPA
jgi:hypothetical protein